jgi:hypothetical protein
VTSDWNILSTAEVRFLHKTNENIEIREELIGFRHSKSIRGERIADIIVLFLNEVPL